MPENDDPLNDLSKPFLLHRANGPTLTFNRVLASDRVKFVEEFSTYRKIKLVETLGMSGATREEVRKELKEFDARQIREGEALYWLNTPMGQLRAILYSLGTEDVAPLNAMNLLPEDRLEVACGVMGIGTRREERPLQEAPASGANATGAETGTSSPATAESLNPSGSASTSSTPA